MHCVALFLQIDISLCPTILCVCFFFCAEDCILFSVAISFFIFIFFIWPRTNSNNELWAIIGIVAVDVHRLDQFACAWCIGAFVASEWIGGGYFVYIMYIYVRSVVGQHL